MRNPSDPQSSDTAGLVQAYRELDRDCAALHYRIHGKKEWETRLLIPSCGGKEPLTHELRTLCDRINSLPAPSPAFDAVKDHLSDFADGLNLQVNELFSSPAAALDPVTRSYSYLSRIDSRPEEERAELLIRILGQAPSVWNGIMEWLDGAPEAALSGCRYELSETRTELEHAAAELPMLFSRIPESLFSRLEAARQETIRFLATCTRQVDALLSGRDGRTPAARSGSSTAPGTGSGWQEDGGFASEIRTAEIPEGGEHAVPDENRRITKSEAEYRTLLRGRLGVELDELLAWEDTEPEKTREECFRIASSLSGSKPAPKTMAEVARLLNTCAGACASPEEMFTRAREYLSRTRAIAHEYVSFPDSERCDLIGNPFRLRQSFPWGGYEDGDPTERPIHGRMFLNDFNFRAVTDGWIKTNCLHEAYPGHHVQFVRTITDPLPETMKIGAKSIALMEGMCLRTERAFAFVYDDDPYYALFNAYRRHHAAVRIKADLMLYYHGRTIGEAVRLYETELGFDPGTAAGQVRAHEDMPGYFTSYYYGMKKLCDWETGYGFDNKTYTKLLFSLSNVSLATFGKMLRMTEQERNLFFHQFASLSYEFHPCFLK